MSRAAALAARFAQRDFEARNTLLSLRVSGSRNIVAPLPIRPLHDTRPESASHTPRAGVTSPTKKGKDSDKDKDKDKDAAPPPPPQPVVPPEPARTFVTFSHLDAQQSLVQSAPVTGTSPDYGVNATYALTVNESLLARIQSTPFTVRLYRALTAEESAARAREAELAAKAAEAERPQTADSTASASASAASHPPAASSAGAAAAVAAPASPSSAAAAAQPQSVAGVLLGETSVSLAELFNQQQIEGWYAITPPPPSVPPPNFFTPDPDLGLPELFVPWSLHQSQRPPTPVEQTEKEKGAKGSARGSSPSTPEKGKRSSSTERKAAAKKEADAIPVPAEVETIHPPDPPPAPMELLIGARLSRPLISSEEKAAGTIFNLSVPRLLSLPAKWLEDVNQLEVDKEKVKVEAELQIAAWKKKGGKKATKDKDGKRATVAGGLGSPSGDDKKKPGAGAEKSNPAADKKKEKEREREAQLKAISDRLNSGYRYGMSFSIPLGNGHSFPVQCYADKLDLPPPSPASTPRGGAASLEAPGQSPSPRPASGSGGSGQNSARRDSARSNAGGLASPTAVAPTAAGGNHGVPSTPASAAAAAAAKGGAKTSKKAEEEAKQRELNEAAELAAHKFHQRMQRRFVSFDCARSVFLTANAVREFKDNITQGWNLPVQVWRELISIDPAHQANPVLQRDTLSGLALIDLHPLLKAGTKAIPPTSGTGDVEASVKLNPAVVESLEADFERLQKERAAAEIHAGDGNVSPALSEEQLKLGGGAKGSAKGSAGAGGAATGAGAASDAAKAKDRRTARSSMKDIKKEDLLAASAVPTTFQPPVDPYVSNQPQPTVLAFGVSVSNPLVPLVIKPVLSLSDVIPARQAPAALPPAPDVELSEELRSFLGQFHRQYRAIAAELIEAHKQQQKADSEEFLDDGERAKSSQWGADEFTARLTAALINQLNQSGLYQQLKERLKPVLVKLHAASVSRDPKPSVRSSTSLQFEQRLSKVYSEIVDRLHLTLNEFFQPSTHYVPTSVRFQPKLPAPLLLQPDSDYENYIALEAPATELRSSIHAELQAQLGAEGAEAGVRLGVLAQEAELQGDYPRAAVLHQHRCLLEYRGVKPYDTITNPVPPMIPAEKTASYWYDYACFQLRLKHFNAAVEALKQALSIYPGHQDSLLALAAVLLEDRRNVDVSEVLLRAFGNVVAQGEQPVTARLRFIHAVLQGLYQSTLDEPELAAKEFENAQSILSGTATAGKSESETIHSAEDAAAIASATSGGGAAVLNLTLPADPAPVSSVPPTASGSSAAPPAAVAGLPSTTLINFPDGFQYVSPNASVVTPGAGAGAGASVSNPQSASGIATEDGWLIQASRYLLGLGLFGLAQTVLSRDAGESPFKSIQLAKMCLVSYGAQPFYQSDEDAVVLFDKAAFHLSHAIATGVDHGQVIEAFAIRGHMKYQQGLWREAIEAYDTFQDWEPPYSDPLLLYRLATLSYRLEANYERCRDLYLQLARVAPSGAAFLGVARCSSALRDPVSNEQALIQSNRLDRSTCEVWLRLALESVSRETLEVGARALQMAIKLGGVGCGAVGNTESQLLHSIACSYITRGYHDLAVGILQRSVSLNDSVEARITLATLLNEIHQYEAAQQSYNKAQELFESTSASSQGFNNQTGPVYSREKLFEKLQALQAAFVSEENGSQSQQEQQQSDEQTALAF